MKNKEIADIFEKIATYLEIKNDNVFKVRAYRRAAESLLQLGEDVASVHQRRGLKEIPGLGKALIEKIEEYLKTGKIRAYENLKKEIPPSILDLVEIPSIGPKKARLFYEKLHICSIEDLERAIQEGKLAGIEGIRQKTIENILKGISLAKRGQERMTLAEAREIAERFVADLKKVPEVKRIEVAGSLRRCCETIRDIDILVESPKPENVMDAFTQLPYVQRILAHGTTKSSVLTRENIQVDLRVVESICFGAALLYFTGSKNFNIKLRQLAQKKHMKISEYGIFSVKGKKEKRLSSKMETDILKKLGLPYVPPELREDIGEEELFSKKRIPRLIELKNIRGDLHVHSTWSDGHNSIEDLAHEAQKKGYEYIAISDHSPKLRVASGVSEEDLKKKKKEIETLNRRFKNFSILFGTEVEIDADGNLDYNDKILSAFDIVIAAIHSGFNQSAEQLTKRIIKACQNRYVHIIAHPMGTHIGKRDPYPLDFKHVCQVAKETGTILEINAFPVRLDLNSANIYFARKMGVKFAINTDAHAIEHLSFMSLGVAIARRGWLERKNVINTLSLKELRKALKKS